MRGIITKLRQLIASNLSKDTGIMVVHTDSNAPRPEYPFYSYKFTTVRQNQGESGNLKRSFEKSEDTHFKYDYVETLEFQPKVIMSFMCYAKDVEDCEKISYKAWEWFRLKGRRILANENIVVVNVGDIQDRTTLLITNYEYRQGFDVEFRILHEFEDRMETIENYKIEKGGSI